MQICPQFIFKLVGAIRDLFLGADVSDCPLPCEISSTETKVFATNSDWTGFGLNFQQTVEVAMCVSNAKS